MTRGAVVGELADRIAAIRRPHPVRVAVDGVDAAGKSTLADEIGRCLEDAGARVIRACVDDFLNPASIRYGRDPLTADSYYYDAFDYPALIACLLRPLGPGGSLEFRRKAFDVVADRPIDARPERAPRDSVLLLDGVFLLRPELRGLFDYSVYVHADFAVTLARAERRDLPRFGSIGELRDRYRRRYVPGQRLYLETARPAECASIVVDNNDPPNPTMRYRAGSDRLA